MCIITVNIVIYLAPVQVSMAGVGDAMAPVRKADILCIYIYIYIQMYTHILYDMYVCVYVYIYIYMYIHIV